MKFFFELTSLNLIHADLSFFDCEAADLAHTVNSILNLSVD